MLRATLVAGCEPPAVASLFLEPGVDPEVRALMAEAVRDAVDRVLDLTAVSAEDRLLRGDRVGRRRLRVFGRHRMRSFWRVSIVHRIS
jgi:hypothetical protein